MDEKILKKIKVNKIFNDVAKRYDLMNDLMSFGLHNMWKKKFVEGINIKKNAKILDLGSGTGDIVQEILKKKLSTECEIILSDPNLNMINEGKKKMNNRNTNWVANYAEELPFKSNKFDLVTMSFSLRNTHNLKKSLKEIYRIMKKDAQFLCLEFGKVNDPNIDKIYKFYSETFIPKIGKIVTNSEESYQYLVESIKSFPDQKKISNLMKNNGFKKIIFQDLLFGIATIYSCNK